MSESVAVEIGELSPEARIANMRELLGSMAENDLSDVEQLGEFIDLYNAHEIPEGGEIGFFESLDVLEHNIVFGDSTFDTIVEKYDALGGTPRTELPKGASAVPSELEISLGKAYVAVASASEFFESQERDSEEPEITSRRREFDAFAKEKGYPPTLAGKAWTTLTRRFLYRIQPERFQRNAWYRREDYADFPADLFATYPSLDEQVRGSHDFARNKVTDLRLDALVDLLGRIEPDGSYTIQELLGAGTGPATLEFLKKFAAFKSLEKY